MAAHSALTDQELVALLKHDDRVAFELLFNRYWYKLLKYAFKVIHDQHEAEDLVQEVFYSLWERREKLDDIQSLSSYLHGAVRYKGLGYVRANLYKNKYIESLGHFFEEGHDAISDQLDAKELDAIIHSEIDKLPPRMREIFILSRMEHLSHKEIAERLNISDQTVKKQINRSLHHFRLILDERSTGALVTIVIGKFLL